MSERCSTSSNQASKSLIVLPYFLMVLRPDRPPATPFSKAAACRQRSWRFPCGYSFEAFLFSPLFFSALSRANIGAYDAHLSRDFPPKRGGIPISRSFPHLS